MSAHCLNSGILSKCSMHGRNLIGQTGLSDIVKVHNCNYACLWIGSNISYLNCVIGIISAGYYGKRIPKRST